jgi:hypothetical protein
MTSLARRIGGWMLFPGYALILISVPSLIGWAVFSFFGLQAEFIFSVLLSGVAAYCALYTEMHGTSNADIVVYWVRWPIQGVATLTFAFSLFEIFSPGTFAWPLDVTTFTSLCVSLSTALFYTEGLVTFVTYEIREKKDADYVAQVTATVQRERDEAAGLVPKFDRLAAEPHLADNWQKVKDE